jgi:hypothetical protein
MPAPRRRPITEARTAGQGDYKVLEMDGKRLLAALASLFPGGATFCASLRHFSRIPLPPSPCALHCPGHALAASLFRRRRLAVWGG